MSIPGPWELLIILVIIIAIFGASRIAGIGAALGGSIREFKKAVREGNEELPALSHEKATRSDQNT